MSASPPDLYLSPNQRNLLVAALTSNRPTGKESNMASNAHESQSAAESTPGMNDSSAPGSGRLDFGDDSPFLDSLLEGEGDDSFNFDDQHQMFGDLPEDNSNENGTTSADHLHDKRKSMGGQEDDEDEGGGKRREGEDKQAKKPGRKPLTSEPTSKRKAQNRAAQRAFRERKEKHLKDLETQVEDLKKASEATNHENGLLRAQVERYQVELKEYRKRLSWISSNSGFRQQVGNANLRTNTNPTGSSDFQFQFPKFGDSPNTSIFGAMNSPKPAQQAAQPAQRTASVSVPQNSNPATSSAGRHSLPNTMSRASNSRHNSTGNSPMNNLTASPPAYTGQSNLNGVDSFSSLFSPSILEATRNSPYGYFGLDNHNSNSSTSTTSSKNNNNNNSTSSSGNQNAAQSRGSFDNSYSTVPGLYSGSSVSNTESPGSSSEAHNQMSSIGTSPDPTFHSPNNKLQDVGLNTINEEGAFGQWNFKAHDAPDFDPTGINWLAQQNGGSFDPVLFGDYRETTDSILSQDFGSFVNDAYPLPDLGSPNHNYSDLTATQGLESGKKPDLINKVDTAKENDGSKAMDAPKMMTCNKIWDRLQSMERFRNGEIDIDNLCSELRAKAKCSEGGAVVEEKHVNRILGL